MPNAYSRARSAYDDSNAIRLQKLLAQAGFGSRRKCEDMITEGRVEVDGELVTELGTRVDPHKQQVRVDGSRVRVNPNHVTLALNKPRKVLSAMDDPKGRYTLRDIVGDKYERIFHMGRLDYDSEGLILMTNDGELSQHVMHPKYEVEKTYIATLEGRISGTVCRRLVTTGVQLDDGWIKLPPVTSPWSKWCCIPARTVSCVVSSVPSASRSSVWYAPKSARSSLVS